MPHMTIRPIDMLSWSFYVGMGELNAGAVDHPNVPPQVWAAYEEVRGFQREAQILGYDLDKESAIQTEADSDANSWPQT